ncbi:MAG: hypothetical protein WCV71_03900 [Patescibacteria group bacterium]|jgi:hypothetical protein
MAEQLKANPGADELGLEGQLVEEPLEAEPVFPQAEEPLHEDGEEEALKRAREQVDKNASQ